MLVHENPQNKILHTALVGEMNGLLHSLAHDAGAETWGKFGGPRAYAKWVQPAAAIPTRPAGAPGGRAFFKSLEPLGREEREDAIARRLFAATFPISSARSNRSSWRDRTRPERN